MRFSSATRSHVPNGREHALAAEARGIAVAQLHSLMRAGRRTRRHRGAAARAGREHGLDLDRGVSTGIEDLAAMERIDRAHRTG